MSIPVAVADLAKALEEFDAGYLLTTRDGAIKVVSVAPTFTDGRILVTGPGRGTLANLAENPVVTLVYPPRETGGLSLLVDGTGEVDGEDVAVTPTSGVLHVQRA